MKQIFFIVFIICTCNGYAQDSITLEEFNRMSQQKTQSVNRTKEQSKSSLPNNQKRYSLNANLGMTFGNYTAISFAPQIGYDVANNVTLGTGMGISYYKEDFRYQTIKNTYLSYNIFGRFYPVQPLVIHIQPEISRLWWTYEYGSVKESDNKFVPNFLVGAGLRLNGMIAMIQYDLIQDKNSQYGNSLFYSIGYSFNF